MKTLARVWLSSSTNDGVTWRLDPKSGNPQGRRRPAVTRREVETRGLCHARRGEFSEDRVPGQLLSDTHMVSTLTRGLYHADGQMSDEVYNYGSFKQSKMFAAGVTCSDCHEPHAAAGAGRRRRLQCHASDKYAKLPHTGAKEGVSYEVTCVVPYACRHLHGGRCGTTTACEFPGPISP